MINKLKHGGSTRGDSGQESGAMSPLGLQLGVQPTHLCVNMYIHVYVTYFCLSVVG